MSKVTRALIVAGLLAIAIKPALADARDQERGARTPGTTEVGKGVGTGKASDNALKGLGIAEHHARSETVGELIRRHGRSN